MDASSTPALNDQDRLIIRNVDECLADALELKQWWEEKEKTQNYADKFEIVRTFHRPNSGVGFFDAPTLRGKPAPVMGETHEMLFDRPDDDATQILEEIRREFQEFVLRYFTHVSSFRQPEQYADPSHKAASSIDNFLSWRPVEEPDWQGFGYIQLYYKLKSTGEIGKFPASQQYAMVDLRELDSKYEWIVVKVQIFNFVIKFRPLGANGPQLGIPLQESTYLIFHKDLISNQTFPDGGKLKAVYGMSYALLRVDDANDPDLLAYGPGHFDFGFKTIDFQLLASGEINLRMGFVVNRAKHVAKIPLDPVRWSFALADVFSFGSATKYFSPVKDALSKVVPKFGSVDPVFGYVTLANVLTAGLAAKKLDISRERLEKLFLYQHFEQHYQMAVSTLLTWRYIDDWLDQANLPDWVIKGKTAPQ